MKGDIRIEQRVDGRWVVWAWNEGAARYEPLEQVATEREAREIADAANPSGSACPLPTPGYPGPTDLQLKEATR